VYSAAATGGSDQWANGWQGGITLTGLPGVLPNVLTVVNTSGNVLAGIDSAGDVTGQTVSAGLDVTVQGQSLAGFMAGSPAGVTARGWTPGSNAAPWPSGGLNAANGLTAILELDFTAAAGRDYMLQVLPGTVLFSTPPSANAQYVQRLFYTTDGTTPSTSSTELSGHSPGITPVLASTTLNYPTAYMEYLIPVPAVATTYRFLVAAYCTGAAYEFKYVNSLEMRVTDLGVSTGQFSNAGVTLGSGTTGSGGGKQTYTDLFYAANTYSYRSTGGLQNTNGNCYHGSPDVGTSYWNYSYIGWASAASGRNLYSVLSGYTVNSASIRLTCINSWYSNGMRFGLHTSTSLGAAGYSSILNTGGWFIGEGATSSYPLTAAQWTALMAASTYTVLAPDSPDDYALTWDGAFAGGGAPDSSTPCITVSYTG
jgi:hypothetical protein